jgi:predicted ArsR family transcriptional regulator
MSGPREIIAALGRRGSAPLIVDHLAAHGPSSAADISRAYAISRPGARARLLELRAAGVAELEVGEFGLAGSVHRYYLEPDALRYAARWLDVLADRAEHANRDLTLTLIPLGSAR